MSASLLSIQKLNHDSSFPAYMVVSTAPFNVEDAALEILDPATQTIPRDPSFYIQEITDYLRQHSDKAEVLVVIHGYNTSLSGVRDWFEDIRQHLEKNFSSLPDGFVLIGYRWPSEQIIASDRSDADLPRHPLGALKDKWKASKAVLPVILGKAWRVGSLGIWAGFLAALVGIFTIFPGVPGAAIALIFGSAVLILALIATAPIFTVLVLRLVGYFRDNYRANYYGVPDLVELLRQIDAGVIKSKSAAESDTLKQAYDHHRIKLSFIGHSMGGFVVTNAVRILSDVFDGGSIGTLDAANPHKDPSGKIGNVFCLGRLVLVSPDIPAETIISGRANFLKSSLRRFEEAYLFSNEGDMALRLASTAANYFSFPTRTQDGGYRLGNVVVRSSPPTEGKDDRETFDDYGIIARLPNELLVKVKGRGRDKIEWGFGSLLGSRLAIINDGQPANPQGQPLVGLDEREWIWPHAGELDSLQEGQIVRLPDGQIVSLQAKEYNRQINWSMVEVQENNLGRIQHRVDKDDLFILKNGQFIKLEYRRIARIHHDQIEILKQGQVIQDLSGKVFRVEGGQLYELRNGLPSEVHEALQLVQDNDFVRYQGGEFVRLQPMKDGNLLDNPKVQQIDREIALLWRFPLDYLYIREKTALSRRQGSVALAPNETPMGELFSFFDCTDYIEMGPNNQPMGLLSHANQKKALGFWDYVFLTKDYFTNKIDTHGGYFYTDRSERPTRPDATFSRLAIYGIAALGFEGFLDELTHQEQFEPYREFYDQTLIALATHCPSLTDSQHKRIAATQVLSSICQQKQIQVLLSENCYVQNILGNKEKPKA